MHITLRVARALIAGLLVGAVFVVPAASVRAGMLLVQNCNPSGAGSLTDRIGAAQVGDTILFAVDCPNASPIAISSRMAISRTITIDGTGHVIVISGGNVSGLFAVNPNVTFSINRLTLINGRDTTLGGGAIANSRGIVYVRNCTFTDNHADIDDSGGGAILTDRATTFVSGSTFVGNTANGNQSGGGALFAVGIGANRSTLTVSNSTFSGNTANGVNAGGGGIENLISTLHVTNATFSGNTGGSGGGIANVSATGAIANVANVIIAGNTATDATSGNVGPDVFGAFASGGHNLIGKSNDSSGFTVAGDLSGTIANPLLTYLGSLANNGGLTRTMAPLAGSQAIGHGDAAKCTASPVGGVDQRGVARQAGVCSIGAFEAQPGFMNLQPRPKPNGPVGGMPDPRPAQASPGPPLGAPNPLPPTALLSAAIAR
jgi:hypothetical protein